MEIVILVFCILTCVISAVCCFFTVSFSKKLKSINSDDTRSDIKDLREYLLNEFSRYRQEQNTSNYNQRQEISQNLASIGETVKQLTKTNSDMLTAIYKDIFGKLNELRDKNNEDLQKQNVIIQSSLDKIRESNEKKLEEMRTVVDEKLTNTLTERLDSSFKTVSEQLTNLYKALGEMKEMSGGITEHVSVLNRVLTNVKARGTWAEVQLKNILDQSIPQMYVENYAPNEKSRDRVEFAIKIPSGDGNCEITYLPLDSKFPVEDYIRLCDAADNADKVALDKARKDLEERVLHEAKSVSKYICVPKTTPFAIMYLATEGLYAEIVSSKNGLVEKIQREYNVMIAGPTTITALLNSISMGFKIMAINQKADEVRQILSAVKTQYDKFGDLLGKAKKRIDDAGKTLEEAQRKNEFIQRKLKAIEAVSIEESETILEIPEPSDD